jgi:5'-deoxynucleotidase
MIEYLSLDDIQSVQYVHRWHMVRTSRRQNLAEHSYTVALLAGKVASRLNEPPTPEQWAQTLEYALVHDIPEIDYGDIPTPTKKALAELGHPDLILKMEQEFWRKRGDDLDVAISPLAQKIVILADKVEAFLYYSEEGFDRGIKDRLLADAISFAFQNFREEKGVLSFLKGLSR